jgi:8-oxo-dGTP pyrophosphatase MutT (NUDIX family)
MKNYRKAVFIVAYRINSQHKPEYLILKRKLHWHGWEFPKGGIEKNENILHAVKRECREETGLVPIKIKKFRFRGKFRYRRIFRDRPGYIGQKYRLFACQVKEGKMNKVRLDKKEHSAFKWLEFKEASRKLTHKNQKKCLKIVNRWVEK